MCACWTKSGPPFCLLVSPEGPNATPNQPHGAATGSNVINRQQRSRLNEHGNEGNGWECCTLKALINPVSHQPLTTATPSPPYRGPPPPRSARFIRWPRVPGAINPASWPEASSPPLCPLSPCLPRFHKHNTSLDPLALPLCIPLRSPPISFLFFLKLSRGGTPGAQPAHRRTVEPIVSSNEAKVIHT